jgi:hypothetical protein
VFSTCSLTFPCLFACAAGVKISGHTAFLKSVLGQCQWHCAAPDGISPAGASRGDWEEEAQPEPCAVAAAAKVIDCSICSTHQSQMELPRFKRFPSPFRDCNSGQHRSGFSPKRDVCMKVLRDVLYESNDLRLYIIVMMSCHISYTQATELLV